MIKFIKVLLYPFSLIYGLLMLIRNKLFDIGLLPSKMFDIPVISVGNLSMGGTGKTPHIEYLIRLLQNDFKIAVLSRGYGRKTRGFILAENSMGISILGDEVVQYKNKFPDLIIAVCEKRVKGVEKLLKLFPDLQAILLDDAYQHRYIKPGISILLTDYSKLYINNYVVPTGTLREFTIGAKRTDIICVSKSPKVLSPIVAKDYQSKLKPANHQKLIFSYIRFEKFIPLYGKSQPMMPDKVYAILMVTGVATPYPLEEYLKQHCSELYKKEYGDHHKFTKADVSSIINEFKNIYSVNKIIVTTEKDAKRLEKKEYAEMFNNIPIFYIPIEVVIHKPYKKEFDNQIISYVRTNKRNSRIH